MGNGCLAKPRLNSYIPDSIEAVTFIPISKIIFDNIMEIEYSKYRGKNLNRIFLKNSSEDPRFGHGLDHRLAIEFDPLFDFAQAGNIESSRDEYSYRKLFNIYNKIMNGEHLHPIDVQYHRARKTSIPKNILLKNPELRPRIIIDESYSVINGRHRVIMSKLLDFDHIPIKINDFGNSQLDESSVDSSDIYSYENTPVRSENYLK